MTRQPAWTTTRRMVSALPTPSAGDPDVTTINESGLYCLILTSRKPEAKRFKRWVTAEVLTPPPAAPTSMACPRGTAPGRWARPGTSIALARAPVIARVIAGAREATGKYGTASTSDARSDSLPRFAVRPWSSAGRFHFL